MKMKLQANLPVVFLTLLVICIVVLGYMELKKLNERIKLVEYLVKDKKPLEKKDNIDVKNHVIEEKPKRNISEDNNNRVQEWQINNEKENIINTLNKKEEYVEEIQGEQEGVFVNHAGFPPHPSMMFMGMGVTEDIIDKINNDSNINFENIEEDEENMLINNMVEGVQKEIEEINDEDDDKGYNSESQSISDEDSDDKEKNEGSEEDEESVEGINLKEISEEEEFSKDKIFVDESYSVNELKAICKNLGIQFSGNKSTLIKRIMDNQ